MADFLEFVRANLMWIWLGIMILSVVIEAFTFSLTTIWTAIAAFVMIFLSKTPLPFRWQLLIFLVMSIALILWTRPFAMKKLKLSKSAKSVNQIAGQSVLVVKPVTKNQKGEVKTSNGTLWSALSADDVEIGEGEYCTVREVSGNTLIVAK